MSEGAIEVDVDNNPTEVEQQGVDGMASLLHRKAL